MKLAEGIGGGVALVVAVGLGWSLVATVNGRAADPAPLTALERKFAGPARAAQDRGAEDPQPVVFRWVGTTAHAWGAWVTPGASVEDWVEQAIPLCAGEDVCEINVFEGPEHATHEIPVPEANRAGLKWVLRYRRDETPRVVVDRGADGAGPRAPHVDLRSVQVRAVAEHPVDPCRLRRLHPEIPVQRVERPQDDVDLVHDEVGRVAPVGLGMKKGLGVLKWSRLFGQLEGFDKVYSGCEVTPSSSGLIIAKMTMRCGSVGVSRPQRRHGRQRSPARLPRACGRPPRRPSDSARRRPGVHRPGTSTARRRDSVIAVMR